MKTSLKVVLLAKNREIGAVEICCILTTVGTKAQAQAIADHLVQAKLAACVQIDGPITSVYRWQGTVHCDEEYRCVIKTASSIQTACVEALRSVHPYETPQILAFGFSYADERYARWVQTEVL